MAAMGYKYSRGIGTPLNCSSSVLYYEKLAREILEKVNYISFETIR
jgi:hypothetical protein